ncbi:MAG TPA: FtsQ-type POTRA domain-containing protein [Terriglobales bacterium]|nr:FtsQ-type POTRA domain-containing protein [Terriglobales bacterium]
MARNNPVIPNEEDLRGDEIASSPPEQSAPDSRFADLEPDQEQPFLRAQKRVPIRRGALPKKTAGRIKVAFYAVVVGALCGTIGGFIYHYGAGSWRFRLDSSDNIEISGNQNVTHRQVMEVMGADIGRNVFFIPLEQRQKQLEEISWVETAAVARLLPNRMKVEIRERTPVAFVQFGSRISLIDRYGVIMEMPNGAGKKYSFPVLLNMKDDEPLSTRAARMKLYLQLISDLDSGGNHYSRDLSEVDVTDPDDVKVTVADPDGEVLVHLGGSNFADRFKIFKTHLSEWRSQFQKLDSVDLRYDNQVIVNPDSPAAVPAQPKAMPVSATPVPKWAAKKPAAQVKHKWVPKHKKAPKVTHVQRSNSNE